MVKMKFNRKYYFTVEGETERWYLKWLQKRINNETAAKYTVTLNCPIQKNPLKRAKSLVITGKTLITHIFDYESNEEVHTIQFHKALDAMRKSELLGKQIKYQLGYSNFTFELWMVLHKVDCNGSLTHRKDYLVPINRAYNENFNNLDQYKQEANFGRILGKITLAEVKEAIIRAKSIMQRNAENISHCINTKDINITRKIQLLQFGKPLKKYLMIVKYYNLTRLNQSSYHKRCGLLSCA